MTEVIKKDGSRDNFQPSKLEASIQNVIRTVKENPEEAKQLAKKVAGPLISSFSKKKETSSSDIKQSVLGRLAQHAPEAISAWKSFEQNKRQ